MHGCGSGTSRSRSSPVRSPSCRHLAARPGELVARDELIKTLWADTYVTKAVLKVAVRAIREALDDDADAPRYIETVGREGYRFIGAARDRRAEAAAAPRKAPPMRSSDASPIWRRCAPRFEQALARRRAASSSSPARPGIGKTTLIDRFVDDVAARGGAWLGRGQCLEQYGDGEPYLPVLEAIGRLVAGRRRRRSSPTSSAATRRPGCRSCPRSRPDGRAPRRARARRATTMPARMLREMADALEVFTRRRALVLVLEDLQWSDRSTVDLIACIARRRAAGAAAGDRQLQRRRRDRPRPPGARREAGAAGERPLRGDRARAARRPPT